MNLGQATGERRLLGGAQGAACVRPSEILSMETSLEVGVQHLGQESKGHYIFLAVYCAAPLLGTMVSTLVDFSSRSLCSCWQHPCDSAPLPLAPRCPCKFCAPH